MLSKLILIKSCTYDLAEIDFTRGAAMQLVGGNNVGKSSLIYALNFLFVVNRKHMIFNGGRGADKATMEHYFKEAEGSFIVFEISKRGRKYCIVVWRDGEGKAKYGKLSVAYSRSLFFKKEGERSLIPCKLAELRLQWLALDADFTDLNQQKDVLDAVYQAGNNNDAAVWLQRSGRGRVADDFSRLYRYLMNTRLIDMNALQEILLLADHRDDEGISYTGSAMKDIDELRYHNDRAELLKEQQEAFTDYKGNYQQLKVAEASLGRLAAQFSFYCTRVRADLMIDRGRQESERKENQDSLQEILRNRNATQQQRGATNEALRGARVNLETIRVRIVDIRKLPTEEFLKNSIANVEQQAVTLRLQLAELDRSQDSEPTITRRMADRDRKISGLEGQRRNRDNWLIFQLAKEETDRRRLGAILRDEVLRLDAYHLSRPISVTTDHVRIFDGEFTLPNHALPELSTPEDLSAEIDRLKSEQERDNVLLATARNYNRIEADHGKHQKKIGDLQKQLQQLQTLPREIQEQESVEQQIHKLEATLAEVDKKLRELSEQEDRQRTALDILNKKATERKDREQRLDRMSRKVEGLSIVRGEAYVPKEADVPEPEKLFYQLETDYGNWERLRQSVDQEFVLLRREFDSEMADQEAFIAEVEQYYVGLSDLQENIARLVDNISHRFANPATALLKEYQKFQDFINQKFNRNLAKVQISNIENLRIELVPNADLQRDLESISQLDLGGGNLFRAESQNLTILQKYISAGKQIAFSNLFTLKLKLTVGGKDKTVDLGKQVESDGTDRMLRLVIVMQVISRMVKLGLDNRIVMFIDEVATLDGRNRPQLVRFCKENHFYPIFAAPELVNGFDRYVMISRGKGRGVVIEQDKHYVDVERN